ncbi:GNAT family N-acetyltransferase [SAR202 cluster bacterium AD-812-D07_MRT_10900m]|nr:GNAT family N-acetyltransferase [SAR202 cluster bacterium AD-812-D07_MRT_10900m]
MSDKRSINLDVNPDQVALSPLVPDDVTEQYVSWLNDPQVNRFLEARHAAPHTVQSTRKFVESCIQAGRIHWGIFVDNEHVGTVTATVDWHNKRAEVSNVVGVARFRGSQVAKLSLGGALDYMFGELNLNRVDAGVYANHIGGISLLASLGFRQEAVITQRFVFGSGYVDGLLFGMLNDSWNEYKVRVQPIRVVGPEWLD